jgi:hypothetical protein
VAFEIFFASAVYFALALELAILVSLGKWNSDMHEQGYSIFESRMSGVVSILCILPLLYPVTRTGPLIPEDRRLLRNVLFIFAVVISTYPFVAQTIQNWDPWPDVFQGWEWEAIQKTCFSPLHGVRPRRIVEISSIIAGIVIHSVAAAILVDMLLNIPIPGLSEKTGMLWNSVRKMRCFRKFIKKLHERHYFYYFIRVFALLLPIILAIPLLWEIFRLRKAQKEMAQVTGQMYQGDSWGFGQIVAVVIFLPILIELFQDLGTGVEDGEGRNGTR